MVEKASLLDVGCGSGVLSIGAAKLGFVPVIGVDLDEVADAAPSVHQGQVGVVPPAAQVVADLGLIWPSLSRELRAHTAGALGIPEGNVGLFATQNHTNPGAIVGNMASPLFGQSTNIAGGWGPGADAANRRLMLGLRLSF